MVDSKELQDIMKDEDETLSELTKIQTHKKRFGILFVPDRDAILKKQSLQDKLKKKYNLKMIDINLLTSLYKLEKRKI